MTDVVWGALLSDFVEHRIDERTFHDAFFSLWNALSAANWAVRPPAAIETLFFVVEAYCPDPELRDPDSLYESDDAELRQAAESALERLVQSR